MRLIHPQSEASIYEDLQNWTQTGLVIACMGVEGGGATVYGHQENGEWSFWQEGSSMYLDDNDDEAWKSWATDPVADLLSALPKGWFKMHPTEIHPEFVTLLRNEYERCGGGRAAGRKKRPSNSDPWMKLFSGSKREA